MGNLCQNIGKQERVKVKGFAILKRAPKKRVELKYLDYIFNNNLLNSYNQRCGSRMIFVGSGFDCSYGFGSGSYINFFYYF